MSLERRKHLKFSTRNTEYHLRDRECVGVKDRRTGVWYLHHPAVRGVLLGGMDRRSRLFNRPQEGLRLVFTHEGRDVLTSPVVAIDRPEKVILERYTWRTVSGLIEVAATAAA